MNYEQMKDRELDELVAKNVVKLEDVHWVYPPPGMRGTPLLVYRRNAGPAHYPNVPSYSTDIAAAFTVVEVMRERGWTFSCMAMNNEPQVSATFQNDEWKQHSLAGEVPNVYDAWADTMARAICIAALRALNE